MARARMRERRADAQRETAPKGSLRVDIMRKKGEGSWGGKRNEDKTGEGEKPGRVE